MIQCHDDDDHDDDGDEYDDDNDECDDDDDEISSHDRTFLHGSCLRLLRQYPCQLLTLFPVVASATTETPFFYAFLSTLQIF